MTPDLASFLQQIIALVGSSAGVWGITEMVKRAPSISTINPGQVTRIRSFAAVLSALAVVIGHWSNGTLDVQSTQGVIIEVLNFVVVLLGSHTVHTLTKDVKE